MVCCLGDGVRAGTVESEGDNRAFLFGEKLALSSSFRAEVPEMTRDTVNGVSTFT